ncbi:MAG: Unknown protein [uncultured Thiotrichaceae bacterium]|uniref:DUF2007 domain-containing protein n=1 Tax=uncultured Thiotrichaceae bacterium TaxID=298394 RepID=A0A6S6TQQ8_9GAMM|nr:MAG: Unknown protein [uncultured Thiotrichaceae bacterium]
MNTLKAVATYPESLLAMLDRKKLADAGIPAEVFHHSPDGITYTEISSASLMVAEQDLERATIFLNSHIPEPEPFSVAAPSDRSRIRCPECNSDDINSTVDMVSRIVNLFTIDCDFPFTTSKRKNKKRHHCKNCGHSWTIWFDGKGW